MVNMCYVEEGGVSQERGDEVEDGDDSVQQIHSRKCEQIEFVKCMCE